MSSINGTKLHKNFDLNTENIQEREDSKVEKFGFFTPELRGRIRIFQVCHLIMIF